MIDQESARLERENEELRARLKEAEATIEGFRSGKDEFLALLAHELRGPLAPIRNAVEMLLIRDLPWGMREQLHGLMTRQVESLVRLVNDLLDASRISQGRIGLQPERVDLRDVVARAVESTRGLIKARHHRLAFERGEQEIPVDVDVVRMAQVVHNLLSNAAKFTPSGGTVSVRVMHTAGLATIEVHDTGIGIPPEAFPVVFELFAQVDPGVGRAEGGLGVGLTLARRLTEMHGGQLSGYSAGRGQGTTFTVTLPVAAGSTPVKGTDHAQPEPPAPRRVAIIDDNQDAAESLAMLLRLKGHHVDTFADGETSLQSLHIASSDLVLLDLGLPGMDGYEVARRIRAELGEAAPRIVALSGYGNDADRRRSAAAGFEGHLVKPVHPDVVADLLATLAPLS